MKKVLYTIIGVASVFVVLFITFFILLIVLFISESNISKSGIKRLFERYNEDYSLNLPITFKKIETYRLVHQDHNYHLMIVKVDDDYKLEYDNQVVTERHENFNFQQHFYYLSELDDDIYEISRTVSGNYDWYAFENWNDKGTRVEYLIVFMDYETNYLYVYESVQQIPFC